MSKTDAKLQALGHPIYLDGFASLPLAPEARDALIEAWSAPGNPNSPNASGERAAQIVGAGRTAVADLIGATSSEIVFTSGATEANNLAISGLANTARQGSSQRNRIIISPIEHKTVIEPAKQLGTLGYTISVAPVDNRGHLNLDAFNDLMGDDVLLASVMLANNETGVIQPIQEAAEIAHAAGALFHTDAAQAIGKIPVDVIELDVDYLSLSAHKCYGPIGIGALYIAAGTPRPSPLFFGGGQQSGIRPGTEPVALIAGFGAAARVANENMNGSQAHGARMINVLLEELRRHNLQFSIVSQDAPRVPGGIALRFPGVDADRLCATIAPHVSLSTGSACTSGQIRISHVLESIGLSENDAKSVVRIFAHRYITERGMLRAARHIVEAANRCQLAPGEVHQ